MTKNDIQQILDKQVYPQCHLLTRIIDPKIVIFDPMARMKCQNCGLFNRTPRCAPNVPVLYEIKDQMRSKLKHGIIVIYQNDGSKTWREDQVRDGVIKGKRLKGAAAGMAKVLNMRIHEITQLMMNQFELKKDRNIFSFITGHCNICGKCPLKDKYVGVGRVRDCKKGYSSMEAVGVDVFDLYDKLEIKYEIIPWNIVTLVGGIFL